MKQNKSKATLIIAIILGISVVALTVAFLAQKQKADELLNELNKSNSEKTEVTEELQNMLTQYDNLKSNNDTLNQRLAQEQTKIKKLLKEIKKVKYSNKIALEQYKKETQTLRQIMRSYIVQIDSLNTLNKNLIAENNEVKNKYQAIQEEKQELIHVSDSLSGKVAEAQQLLVGDLSIVGLNKRNKETMRISRILKFKTCFRIKENKIAHKGIHKAYVRIVMPDESVLFESSENLFKYQDKQIVYSAMREFNYQGKELNLCVYYKHQTPQLVSGEYGVDIFIDEVKTNSATFILK